MTGPLGHPDRRPNKEMFMALSLSTTRRRSLVGGLTAGLLALSLAACSGVQGGASGEEAADYPAKPVEFTVPNSPGGSTDLIGRAVARAMAGPLGESVPVVNREGANGAVGGKEVLG